MQRNSLAAKKYWKSVWLHKRKRERPGESESDRVRRFKNLHTSLRRLKNSTCLINESQKYRSTLGLPPGDEGAPEDGANRKSAWKIISSTTATELHFRAPGTLIHNKAVRIDSGRVLSVFSNASSSKQYHDCERVDQATGSSVFYYTKPVICRGTALEFDRTITIVRLVVGGGGGAQFEYARAKICEDIRDENRWVFSIFPSFG